MTGAGVPCRQTEHTGERGSQVVEFVLVQFLVLALVCAILQIGYALHVRNLASYAAAEGARRGAIHGGVEDEDVSAARQAAGEVVDSLIGRGRDNVISAQITRDNGVRILRITVTTTLPVIGPWGPRSLSATGSAMIEEDLHVGHVGTS